MNKKTMTKNLFVFIFSVLIFSVFSNDFAQAQDKEYSLRQGMRKRSYIVHVPPSYRRGTPTPVVLAFHGGGGSAIAQITSSGMNETSDREGFIAVYPQGTSRGLLGKKFRTWNAGRCCGYARDRKVNDVAFVNSVINDLERKFSVDPKRIYATGLSNGAGMTYRLGCELSNRIAAIAPVASIRVLDECKPSRPVPTLHFHGTADPTSFYKGGTCGGAYDEWFRKLGLKRRASKTGSDLWECRAVPEFISEVKDMNGCADTTEIIYGKGKASCFQYTGCKDDASVGLCTIQDAGHTWPGGQHGVVCKNPNGVLCKTYAETVGPISKDISANDVMWEFFKKHPLK